MIRHIVLTQFREDVSDAVIAEIYAGLAAVAARLDGAQGFAGGRSDSPEQLQRGYTHGFSIDFDDAAALARYAQDAAHKALGVQLVASAEEGVGGLLVMDLKI